MPPFADPAVLLRAKALQTQIGEPVDLQLAAGECVCLSGPSGAGKTLLLRAIADLDPRQGRIWLDGRLSDDYVPADWRRLVGLLPAESRWWEERVGEHFTAPGQARLSALDFGPEVMNWAVQRCSTGERQRLALLRLLQNRPRVLLLDEPTASLDPDSVARVEALIAAYRREHHAAVLWISHDPGQIARVADRKLFIEDGRLREAA